jgi:hypothetical protein
MISRVAPGQMGWVRPTIALSMMSRWISGVAVVTSADSAEAPNATLVSRLCRRQ